MANAFVAHLNRINTALQVQNARENRMFIEARYMKNLQDLTAAEDSLRMFQQRYGIIAMPEQTEASIKAAAEITAQIALKEVEEGVLRRTTSDEHPALAALRVEVEELRRKLADMSTGAGGVPGGMTVFVPFNSVPRLGAEYVRRFREVEIQYKILQFITPLYEQAKVEEKRQTPSVLVLDRAVPAERKARPKVSLFALVALVGSGVVGLVGVFLVEGMQRVRSHDPERFDELLSILRREWLGLRGRGGAPTSGPGDGTVR
jgi:capsule polysaccharide export protein KpsE/RkpR